MARVPNLYLGGHGSKSCWDSDFSMSHASDKWTLIFILIVSITKFSIVIGSPRAYWSRNRRAVTWMSNYRYPIWIFHNCLWTPVIGYPRDSQATFDILKFSLMARPRGHKQKKWINMSFNFLCLCLLGLDAKLNFNISKTVYHARFNCFLHIVSYSFQNFWKALQTFSLKRSSQKTFFIPKFVIDTIN